MKRRFRTNDGVPNMTPMIDVVFQMIIFFVCTAQLDRERFDAFIALPAAPHAPAATRKDPRTVTIELDARGRTKIGRTRLSSARLRAILLKTANDFGAGVPVRIRADAAAEHRYVRRALEACAAAGLFDVSFVVVKGAGKGEG